MKIYLKWTLLVFGPVLLIAAAVGWFMTRGADRLSRDELDDSYNREQVERLQAERAEKKYLDEQWRKQNRPKTGQ